MTYATDGGAYLFPYTSLEDGPCELDEWYESLALAEQQAEARFGLKSDNWKLIDDPLAGAQHDWIRPTAYEAGRSGQQVVGSVRDNPSGGISESVRIQSQPVSDELPNRTCTFVAPPLGTALAKWKGRKRTVIN